MTFEVESQLRSAVTSETLAALGNTDFISQEIKYDKQCIIQYMNSLRPRTDVNQKQVNVRGNRIYRNGVVYIQ